MTDLETRIQREIDAHVQIVGPRAMPHGTRRRVRRREAGTVVFGAAGVAAFVAVLLGLASIVTNHGSATHPQNGGSAHPKKSAAPFPSTIVPPQPGSAPQVTLGGDFAPFVDTSVLTNDVVAGSEVAVSYGTVQGVPWTLLGYQELTHGIGASAGISQAGQCAGLSLGTSTEPIDATGSCWYPSATPDAHASLTGWLRADAGIPVLFGTADPAVTQVKFRFPDGSTQTVDTVYSPALDAGLFVLFTSSAVLGADPSPAPGRLGSAGAVDGGTVAMIDINGNVLSSGSDCFGVKHADTNGTCGGPI